MTSLRTESAIAQPFAVDRAGRWLLESGIQEQIGGIARYYRSDLGRNHSISTELTGYGISAFVYLHSLTGEQRYLDRALQAAHFLTRVAWDKNLQAFPFEYSIMGEQTEPLTYFFDSGIIVRGLLALWRVTRDAESFEIAQACGRAMVRDFAPDHSVIHPILRLPEKQPAAPGEQWSRSPGCYQLKSALGLNELFEATGDTEFRALYDRVLDQALQTHESFLPGHQDRVRVMDRLHAYCYFLEGLSPALDRPGCAAALAEGIDRAARYLQQIAPVFERSDVYAQLLRLRVFAEAAGIQSVDRLAAQNEIARLATFQHEHTDLRIKGGFYFGRKGADLLPFINPASTAFSLQAFSLWDQYQAGQVRTPRQMLI